MKPHFSQPRRSGICVSMIKTEPWVTEMLTSMKLRKPGIIPVMLYTMTAPPPHNNNVWFKIHVVCEGRRGGSIGGDKHAYKWNKQVRLNLFFRLHPVAGQLLCRRLIGLYGCNKKKMEKVIGQRKAEQLKLIIIHGDT